MHNVHRYFCLPLPQVVYCSLGHQTTKADNIMYIHHTVWLLNNFSEYCVVLLHLGQGKPPMFGDYEAQRHWMEITYNLPLSHW